MLREAPEAIVELMGNAVLSPQERAVLDFERSWWTATAGNTKAEAIRRQLDLSASRYYELLDELCDSGAALAYDPLVVHRLRRRRLARRRARVVGSSAPRRSGPR